VLDAIRQRFEEIVFKHTDVSRRPTGGTPRWRSGRNTAVLSPVKLPILDLASQVQNSSLPSPFKNRRPNQTGRACILIHLPQAIVHA
jgi:hypothetical protein